MIFFVTNHISNYLTNWLAISVENSPSWEAKSFSDIQEIPRTLWNKKAHYHIQNRRPSVPILSQINPVESFPSKFLKIHCSIIIPSKTRSSELAFSVRFPHQNPVCTSPLPHPCLMPRLYHSSWFDEPKTLWWATDYEDSHCGVICAALLPRPF